VAQLDSAAAS